MTASGYELFLGDDVNVLELDSSVMMVAQSCKSAKKSQNCVLLKGEFFHI